jgi:RNA polymerase sigma-70 factor (ECF subfamily)
MDCARSTERDVASPARRNGCDDVDKAAFFDQHRRLLFSVAYRMLGTIADAEDAVQDAWLRWETADVDSVASPRAYLVTVVTRICIDVLRSVKREREAYRGPWLPEPLVEQADSAGVGLELAESLSMALLVLLERLSPLERAAFLLREVFEFEYDEIARIIEKSEPNCRQLLKRAKDRIHSNRARFEPTMQEQERLTSEFVRAVGSGDIEGLVGLFAEGCTLYSDGGGKVSSATRPIHGALSVAKFLVGVARKYRSGEYEVEFAVVNGQIGLVMYHGNEPENVMSMSFVDGEITEVFAVRNPDKLIRVPRLTGH